MVHLLGVRVWRAITHGTFVWERCKCQISYVSCLWSCGAVHRSACSSSVSACSACMLSECASGVPRAIYRPDASILHEMGSRKGCTTLSNTISILEALWSRPVAARLTGLPARSSIVAERARLPDACGSDRTGERTRPRATAESMAVATRVGTFAPSFDWVLVQA